MKKSAIILSILTVGFFTMTAFAEDQTMDPGMDMQQPDGQQQGGGMMGGKGMMGKMGGKGMMHQSSMVATPDGGVIVLTGNKLTKYDTNLNVVKEVEVKGGPDMGRMGNKMDKMKWKEMPQNDSGPQPMNDEQVAAALDQEPPAEAPSDAPPAQEPPPGQ